MVKLEEHEKQLKILEQERTKEIEREREQEEMVRLEEQEKQVRILEHLICPEPKVDDRIHRPPTREKSETEATKN